MSEKFKKINKAYTLSDSSLNVYDFRLLTSGYQMPEYAKNPIGYHMHAGREDGVLVKWEDLKMDGDTITGKPVINLSHPRGQRTVEEVENGFLNAASMGHFVVLELSDDPALKLPNQKGPTVTKWFNRECSLVDIPGNYNALKLFDKDDNEINLADFTTIKNAMKQIFLTPEQIGKLNLKADTADAAAVATAFENLVATAAKVEGLTSELSAAQGQVSALTAALTGLKTTQEAATVENLIAAGVTAKKFTVEVGNQLKTAFAGKPAELKSLVDAMPVYTGVVANLGAGAAHDAETAKLAAMSFDELDQTGQLPNLYAKAPTVFQEKYKAKFGKEYVPSHK